MKMNEIFPGKRVRVNGVGDLFMDGDLRPVIYEEATVVKITKSGKIQVEREGKLYSIPLRNLDEVKLLPEGEGPLC